jgi:DDE superfamily endonuclease
MGEALGLSVWVEDEAGPYRTQPYQGTRWQPEGQPARQAHEYKPNGTAKMLTLFHPKTGELRVKGVISSANAVLHPWLKTEFADILAQLPKLEQAFSPEETRALWENWQTGLIHKVPLPAQLPPLRCLVVWDNLKGHKSVAMVEWLINHGIMPLYTPLGGSWLNMAESIQRIIKRRALEGQHPTQPEEIIEWLEATARGWNANPTPFEWGGERQTRRQRARARRLHRLGGSGACTTHPISRSDAPLKQWLSA